MLLVSNILLKRIYLALFPDDKNVNEKNTSGLYVEKGYKC